MATTTNGVSAGLDVNSLVSQLMAVEQRPLTLMNAKEAQQQADISAYGQLRSALNALENASKGLGKYDTFYAKKASSSNSSLATASANANANVGSYTLTVLQMAQSQNIVSSPLTNPGLSPGTLTINFGQYTYDGDGNVTGFTPDQANSLTVEFDKGGTIEDLRDAINKQGKGKIKADIIDNGSGKQLVLNGDLMGDKAAFTVSGANGLKDFSYDASNTSTSTMQTIQKAQNSSVLFGGLKVSRDSNKLENIISGLTIDLVSADPNKSVTIKVEENRSAATTAMENFVKAYNEFASLAADLTAYDEKTKTGGPLLGDATIRTLQSQLRTLVGQETMDGNVKNSLSKIGVSFDKYGKLEFNKSKFEKALNDPNTDLGSFFTGKEGFATKAEALFNSYLDSNNGILAKRTNSINSTIERLDKQREAFGRRLVEIEKRYRAQFTALDVSLAKMQSTSNYLAQHLANLPKAGG